MGTSWWPGPRKPLPDASRAQADENVDRLANLVVGGAVVMHNGQVGARHRFTTGEVAGTELPKHKPGRG